ncbi:MAG: BolA family transcriptional regulator [Proteobacteria bacterium]|nr:BolA family transcriptional regulator [Pseudomonadota bacterium]
MSAASVEALRAKLIAALDPQSLEVIDEGHLHIGHAGEGSGHFRVRIVSAAFVGKSAIERHRLVYAAVGDLIGRGVHALAIEARPPEAA